MRSFVKIKPSRNGEITLSLTDIWPYICYLIVLFSVKDLVSSQDVSSEKIILGGFSQGGALALYTALTMDKSVAGIVGLSTWMPLHKKFKEEVSEATFNQFCLIEVSSRNTVNSDIFSKDIVS